MKLGVRPRYERWKCGKDNGRGLPIGIKARILRELRPSGPMLHLCCGEWYIPDATNLDIRPAVKPDIVADATMAPFPDASFSFVLADPSYPSFDSKKLYNTEQLHIYSLLVEMSRLTSPGGLYCLIFPWRPNTPRGDALELDALFCAGTHRWPRVLAVWRRGAWPGSSPCTRRTRVSNLGAQQYSYVRR